jgi:hypothetical protein
MSGTDIKVQFIDMLNSDVSAVCTYEIRVLLQKRQDLCCSKYIVFSGEDRVNCTGCWWGSLRERGHWGDQDVDGRIILRWIFRKLEGVVGTGWSWLRIGTGGGHLWLR